MDVKPIQALYDYNRWANARILAAAAKLTLDQFTQDLGSSYRSVRDTLTHLLSSEWIWLMRWRGTSPKEMLSPSDFPTVALLRKRWAEVESEQTAFLSRLTPESVERPVAYLNTKGERWQYPLWQILLHVVNHATYHRGQVTTMLRQLGAEPVATDFLVFYDLMT